MASEANSAVGKWVGRIGWLVVAAAPPLVVFWQHFVIAHPVWGGMFLLGYEGLLAGGRTIGGPLLGRWRDRLVDRADRALGRRFSSFDRRYRAFVSGALRYIDVKGLATIGFYTPELDEVFVDVRVAPSPPIDISPGVLAAESEADAGASGGFTRRTLSDFLDDPTPAVVAIIGGPGVGKTTLLLHTARQSGSRSRGRRPVPILLFLRDHVRTILADRTVTLPDVVRNTLGRHRAEEPTGWFEHHLASGDCVVLLDGLDEIAGQADRRALADWVESQIRQYPNNDYVVTSRPHGYLTARIDGATVLHALPLTDEQVSRFVGGWFRAFESATDRYNRPTGHTPEAAATRADAATNDLLGRLAQAPELYDLTANPMLLTMIVNVHRFRGQLPGSRADLYGEICQVMLGRRQLAKSLPVELSADRKEMVLRGLAFGMMCQRVRDLRRDDVLTTVAPLLDRVPESVSAADFLAEVGSSGILVERENGLYSFAHQTFQEYLAAAHIRERGLTTVLTNAVDDVWWRETTLLYAARSDADPVVRACLRSGSVIALSLAFDCEAQPSEIAPELRARLTALLDSAVDPDTDPQRRALMAGVMVTRHLRHRTIAADAPHVCTHPVTTNLYRLFLRETHSQPPDEPWLLGPDGDHPIMGVYGRESAAFARWVNTITAGEPTCRLPTRSELDDPVVRRVLNSTTPNGFATTWLHPGPGGGDPELWSPPGQPHPYTVDSAMLVEHLAEDASRLASTLARLLLLRSVVLLPSLTYARASALAGAAPLDGTMTADLIRTLGLAGALDDTLHLAHGSALVRDLDADSARALERSRARARALSRDSNVDFAHALARTADHGEAHARAGARAGDTASAGDSARANERTRELLRDLVHNLEEARSFVRHSPPADVLALDVALGRGLGLARTFDGFLRHTGVLDEVLTSAFDTNPTLATVRFPQRALARIMGTLLSGTLADALAYHGNPVVAFPAAFGRALISGAIGADEPARVIRPDELADLLTDTHARLHATAGDPARSWDVRAVADRLHAFALPVFTWQRALTPAGATAIRLAALCLAVEVRTTQPALAEGFRTIAAGVTLLQRRTDGRAPLTETIMLTIT